jgi:hypothetical protein
MIRNPTHQIGHMVRMPLEQTRVADIHADDLSASSD